MSENRDDIHNMRLKTEMRTFDESHVLSSMKKRLRIPLNLPKITPLNFDEIKKEIEEYEQEEKRSFSLKNGTAIGQSPPETKCGSLDVISESSNGNSESKSQDGTKPNTVTPCSNENNMTQSKSARSVVKPPYDNHLSAVTPCFQTKNVPKKPAFHTPCSKENKMMRRKPMTSNNDDVIPRNIRHSNNMESPWRNQDNAKENELIQKNDSFDLNFSALTISTPAKQQLIVPATPVNRLQSCKMETGPVFINFVTPKVNNRQPALAYSISRKPLMKSSRQNSEESFANEVVPLPTNNEPQEIICTIPKVVPKDETFKRLTVNSKEYIVLSPIGKGGSSEVFQCFCLEQKQLVAIKCVSLNDKSQAIGYINEVKLLQRLQHCDRIITMFDYEILEGEKKLLMVLEKGGQDLSKVLDKLAKKADRIPMYKVLFYSMEMVYAVKQIHDEGVIHSDLKPANFIEVIDGLKLIDFGIASTVQPDMTSALKMNAEGSCNYISPEALKETTSSPNKAKYKVHYKSDVWSLGCILYQLVYRKPPFHHVKNMWSKLALIVDPNHKIAFPPSDCVPKEFINLIKMCLKHNVRDRPCIQELVELLERWNCVK